jgi:hypothetical protein
VGLVNVIVVDSGVESESGAEATRRASGRQILGDQDW